MKKLLFILTNLYAILFIANAQDAGQKELREQYVKRAEEMFQRVWQYYRVPQHGLFSEYYPQQYHDSLTYMQEGNVKSKEVSYLWPFSGMVSATNAMMRMPNAKGRYALYLDSCIAAMEMYKDTVRKPAGYQAYPVKFEKVDRYYDDNGLVGIDYMEAYKNTKNPLYLQRAKVVFKFIQSGWSETLGGGVTWLEGHQDQKPACSNGMATLTALKIYEGSKEKYYLEWGKKFYNWMYKNLRDSAGLYCNDKKTADGALNKVYYTYNSGSMIEAAVMLYKFTGDKKYLNDAKVTAEASYKYFGKADPHMRSEFCDLPWFATVLLRGYIALYNIDKNRQYIDGIMERVNYAWEKKDNYQLMYHNWSCVENESSKPKWLLDEACIAEIYARMALIM